MFLQNEFNVSYIFVYLVQVMNERIPIVVVCIYVWLKTD